MDLHQQLEQHCWQQKQLAGIVCSQWKGQSLLCHPLQSNVQVHSGSLLLNFDKNLSVNFYNPAS